MLMESCPFLRVGSSQLNDMPSIESPQKNKEEEGGGGHCTFCFVDACVICSYRGQVAPFLILIAPSLFPPRQLSFPERTRVSQPLTQPQPPRQREREKEREMGGGGGGGV